MTSPLIKGGQMTSQQSRHETGFLDLDGTRLYYEVGGSGLPILLLHAGIGDSRMWDVLFAEWSQSYRVIRCDMRGFGRTELAGGEFSDHGDLERLLDHLSVDRAVVVGPSYGGQVALDLALASTTRVLALVLVSPNVSGWPPPGELKSFAKEEGEALDDKDLDAAVALNVRTWVDGPHRGIDVVNPKVREAVATMQRQVFEMEIPKGFAPHDLEPAAWGRLKEIDVKTLVLAGDLDLACFQQLAAHVADSLPNASLVTLPAVAHVPFMEAPEAFGAAVRSFLDECAHAP
jgi:3-oxoadipate enol-lactonase